MKRARWLVLIAAWVALGVTVWVQSRGTPLERVLIRERLTFETVATGLQFPWSVAFLPEGRFLVTERGGAMRIVDAEGRLSAPLSGLPPIHVEGQGGLLDVALTPEFSTTRELAFSFAEPRDGGASATAVAFATLGDTALTDVRVIWRQPAALTGGRHFGSRLVFARDGRLFVTTGERAEAALAQDLLAAQGKVVRLERDGGVPLDNPFVGRGDALPEVWSFGHRNPQGAALHPITGELWTHEHGPQGGDEVNIARGGRNYGWPLVSHGVDYGGAPIGDGGSEAPGIEVPLHTWTPSIAPSGMCFVTSPRFPKWKGSLLVGGLIGQVLVRLQLEGERVVSEERHLVSLNERIRDVREGPDGFLYVLTDSAQGRLIRITDVE